MLLTFEILVLNCLVFDSFYILHLEKPFHDFDESLFLVFELQDFYSILVLKL